MGMRTENVTDMQGLRKSATMHKLWLTDYDVQVARGEGGQTSAATILDHYDEVLGEDRRKLSLYGKKRPELHPRFMNKMSV